ncbi:MAG: alpha/beta fold hydrolase [Candidatus Gastranaerophilales bacterium]|nr:alpha/beta fold hydrolase [Candidatus Gastranaerophilales bacterium]
MRKFFGYLVISVLFFSLVCASDAAPKKKVPKTPPEKHKIEFTTRDKFILVGDLYFAKNPSNKPLVVCLHSFSLNSQVWKDFAKELRLKDYNVLAMDLRGHGRSVYNENLKLKSRFYYKAEDWQKLPKDVVDSVKYVRANYPKINTDKVIIIGADIGASAGAIASMSLKYPPEKLILISPMFEFKGLRMPVSSPKFNDTKILMLLSKANRVFMNFDTKTPVIVRQYANGGPGNNLLRVNKEANIEIMNFIEK